MLPAGLRNHRKHPVISDPYDGAIPTSIPPISEKIEKRIVGAMFTELNDVYGLTLDVTPDTSRQPNPSTGNGQDRLIFLGASHMKRLSEAAAQAGADVCYVGAPGWVAAKDSLAEAAMALEKINVTENDIVVMDLFSNNAFMGTDECGLPCRAQKGRADGRYHTVGDLQAAPKTVFEKIYSDSKQILNVVAGCKTVFFAPIPRYVSGKCCSDSGHLSNWGSESFTAEIRRACEMAELATSAGSASSQSTFVDILSTFDSTDPNLTEVRTAGGHSIWLDSDPVHLSHHAYAELAGLVTDMMLPDDASLRPRKRARLESVVPALPGGRRGHQGRIRPPLWVSGMATRGGGGGRGRGPYRGRPRGAAPSFWRPRGRGQWNPAPYRVGRGARASRGRWGRY